VIEDDHEGAFISSNPRFTMNLHGNEIPWMTGITSEEGAMKSAPLIYNSELTEDLLKSWERALPISLYYDHFPSEIQEEITKKIDDFYFKNQKLIEVTKQNLTDLYTDGWFFSAMIEYLKIRFSNENHAETFVYLFTHKGSCSFTEIFKGGAESYYGTSHAEELQYLFPIRKDLKYFFNSIPTNQDKEVTRILTKYWVNFAYHG
jgi:carboxylesterase type B